MEISGHRIPNIEKLYRMNVQVDGIQNVEHVEQDNAAEGASASPKTAPAFILPVTSKLPFKVCPYCADPDCDNPLFCQSYEPGASALDTTLMTNPEDDFGLPVSDMWGNALFSPHKLLLIEVAGVSSSFVLHPGERLVLGRVDGHAPQEHRLDLSLYEAHSKGVSRAHAAITQTGHTLMLTDLGSTNGTFLNEQRLVPNQSRILRDGDQIRLGQLVAQVRFK